MGKKIMIMIGIVLVMSGSILLIGIYRGAIIGDFYGLICGWGATVGGVALIIAGFIGIYKTKKRKEEFEKQYSGKIYSTQCLFCKRTVKSDRFAFRMGRYYPEGYIRCPYCKKPLSFNLFDEVKKEGN